MGDIRFVFRFRDLVASTIREHQKIIDVHGSCWWGWWKRPSEDGRSDVWGALEEETSNDTPQSIGLFNSGDSLVFVAEIVEVIVPSNAAHDTISVPAGQEHLVPSYYRESPFSRAWMKVTRITSLDAFFGAYSYAEVPKLSGYTQATLHRLRNKKILSAEELRLMDTTVWEVREAHAGDPDEQILLSTSAVSSAVSREVLRCAADNVLHITDLHYACGRVRGQHRWRLESETEATGSTLVEAVTSALSGKKIGVVIASGDFTFLGSGEEFDEAATALLHLLGVLDLSTDHLIIIPGNHDIQWSTDATYDPASSVTQAPAVARKNYEAFYERVTRHRPDKHLAMGRRFVLPCGVLLEICALNSSTLQHGKNFLSGMGRIDEAAFAAVSNQLGWQESGSLAFRMLVMHHHLALTEDLESPSGFSQGFGIAVDAVRIQRLAAKRGAHLALHGHKHRAFLWRSSVFELPEHANTRYRLGDLSIIGGGSAGSTEVSNQENFFNLLEFSSSSVSVHIYRSRNNGTFDLMQRWQANLRLGRDVGRLELDDWQLA